MSLAKAFGRPTTFYDGTPGRRTVTCPDCALPADELFGDHGGDCLDYLKIAPPTSALGIIRKHALANRRFSANDVRPALDAADIPGPTRGPAFAAAERRQWIKNDGDVKSLGGKTKKHRIAVYESLIYRIGRTAS